MPYPIATIAAAIQPGEAKNLVEWWIALRRDRRLPSRTDFYPEDIARWWSNIILYDVERSDGRIGYRFRVHGEHAVASDGGNFTGRLLDDVLPPEMSDSILRDYSVVVSSGKPVYSKLHREAVQGYPVEFERLLLPFGAEQVTSILCFLRRISIHPAADAKSGLQNSEKPFLNDFIALIDD